MPARKTRMRRKPPPVHHTARPYYRILVLHGYCTTPPGTRTISGRFKSGAASSGRSKQRPYTGTGVGALLAAPALQTSGLAHGRLDRLGHRHVVEAQHVVADQLLAHIGRQAAEV